MNIQLLDKYILGLIEKNGWYVGRRFRDADSWITEIEGYGYQSFESARQIIGELGGLSFHEYAPLTYRRMIELKQKEEPKIPSGFAADIKAACEDCLDILKKKIRLKNIPEQHLRLMRCLLQEMMRLFWILKR